MTAIPQILSATVLALLALTIGNPGHARDRLVWKNQNWHVYCSKDETRTHCRLLHPRWRGFTRTKNERLRIEFLGPSPGDNGMFLISTEANPTRFRRLEVKVDGAAYDPGDVICEKHCLVLIGVDGPQIDIFRRGRVMTLRQLNASGVAFGPEIAVSLSGFTAAEKAARRAENKANHRPAWPWKNTGPDSVTTSVTTGRDRNIRQTLGVTCARNGSTGETALFLRFENHPDLANVEYIAVWHRLDGGEETKVRWTPAELEGGTRGFVLSGDEAMSLLKEIGSAKEIAVRTAWTKVTFNVAENRKVLSRLVADCAGS